MQGSKGFNPNRILQGIKPRNFQRLLKIFIPIRNAGVKTDHISDDWCHWKLRLPMSTKTRNYVGTHWGGTLYSSVDSPFMLAWLNILGPDYVVWDKEATIRFLRPGKGTLHADVIIDPAEIDELKVALEDGKQLRTYSVAWRDKDDNVVCEVDKTLYFRKA